MAALPPKPASHKPEMGVSGQLGSLDAGKVDQTFAGLSRKLSGCIASGSKRVEFLSGHAKFFVRIAETGASRYVYLSESTLGDRDAEKCMLGVVQGTRFPPPIGGEGQAQKAFDFDLSPDVRGPVAWSADRASVGLAEVHGKLAECTAAAPGIYHATVYVQTDGTVLGAGVAPPNEKGELSADCVTSALRAMKLPSPGSWPAKVSFDVR